MNSRTFASKSSKTFAGKAKTKAPSTKSQQPQGKIMTLSDLHREDNWQDEEPKMPKTKQNGKPGGFKGAGKKPTQRIPGAKNGPVKIGQSQDPDKWRCKICSFLNEEYEDVCKMCDSEKGEVRRRDMQEKGEEDNEEDQE